MSDHWLTVSQATYVQHDGPTHVNQASVRRARELQDAFEKRSSSPMFVARSNSELSFTNHAVVERRIAGATSRDKVHSAFRKNIPFETSMSRASFVEPPLEVLLQARQMSAQAKAHHDQPIKTCTFSANSENRREYQQHKTTKPPRGKVEERSLRTKPCKFEANSTYQASFQ
jgi:hypothetical protein